MKETILVFPYVPLGDEISIYRNGVLELFQYEILDKESTILIHSYKDRHFLYPMFPRIYSSFDEIEEEKATEDYDTIHLFEHCPWPKFPYHDIKEITYFKPFLNLNGYPGRKTYFNNENNECLINLMKMFRKDDEVDIDSLYSESFVVVHYRKKNDEMWNTDESTLTFLLENIQRYRSAKDITVGVSTNVVIFGNVPKEFQASYPQYSFITNLQLYCTLLNHPRCSHLFTTWSGGGQISGYVGHPGLCVIFFFHPAHSSQWILEDIANNNSSELETNKNWFDCVNVARTKRFFYSEASLISFSNHFM